MLRIRRIEEEIERRYHQDQMKTPIHLVIGQEATSVGACAALAQEDLLYSSHRTHGNYLAKGGDLKAMSRRFGVSECARAGMSAASGDAIIIMDADLQDPPEVIPQLIEKWRAGADVVHTVRTHRRGESAAKMMLTRLAYRIIHMGSSIELPVDAGDFKLLSRAALNHLLALQESDPYLRGLVVWIGFQQAFVPYEREARHAGRTHFPFFSRNPWKTFAIGLTSFSFMLRIYDPDDYANYRAGVPIRTDRIWITKKRNWLGFRF